MNPKVKVGMTHLRGLDWGPINKRWDHLDPQRTGIKTPRDEQTNRWDYQALEEIPDFKLATTIADATAAKAGRERWDHPQVITAYEVQRSSTEKNRGLGIIDLDRNFSYQARDRAIRFDYIYKGLTISELQEKWGLSERKVYYALGSMREANNRRARWKYSNRRA